MTKATDDSKKHREDSKKQREMQELVKKTGDDSKKRREENKKNPEGGTGGGKAPLKPMKLACDQGMPLKLDALTR